MKEGEPGLEDVRTLITRAFSIAKQKGKDDWRRMTTAVLKNRFLDLTEGRFDEKQYGFQSMFELVAEFPDLLDLDRTTTPATVLLRTPEEVDAPPTNTPRTRIRPDLWHAVYDYSSRQPWAWDPIRREAHATDEPADFALPTFSEDEFRGLRSAFVEECSTRTDLTESDLAKLREWGDVLAGTVYLPASLRGEWNARLKEVALTRLTEFFRAHDLPVPDDLLTVVPTQGAAEARSELDELRDYATKVVAAMTHAELRRLTIPLSAAQRVIADK